MLYCPCFDISKVHKWQQIIEFGSLCELADSFGITFWPNQYFHLWFHFSFTDRLCLDRGKFSLCLVFEQIRGNVGENKLERKSSGKEKTKKNKFVLNLIEYFYLLI